jgi:glucose-1-phosphate adenylyltransferase
MTNSNVNKVAVITQYNSRSLHDHLSSAKWWDFGRKQGGLFVFNPFLSKDNQYWFRGTADSIYQNITFLKKSNEPYVVVTSGDAIYKMDYQDIINYHIEKEADITIVYKKLTGTDMDPHSFGIMELDENGQMLDLEEKPVEPQSDCASLGIYVFQRTLLIKLLETIASEERYDIVSDIFIRYRKKLKIFGYEFKGYWKTLNSVQSYIEANMDFLKREHYDAFIKEAPYIHTKPKDEPPAKYNMGAEVKNALVGSGSILNGVVSHSVLFRKVFTGDNSKVINSVILEGSFIGKGCTIENAIIDKDVVISDGKSVIGTPEEPVVIAKGTVV